MTNGPVLELGTGLYSTTFLHWYCFSTKRKLVSYENSRVWHKYARRFRSEWHDVNYIRNWDTVDLTPQWSVAFVDHAPNERRIEELKRLTHSDYVVIHDTDRGQHYKYKYRLVEDLYKYRYRYSELQPATSIWSNKNDVTKFSVSLDEIRSIKETPPRKEDIIIVPEAEMVKTHPGKWRRFTICRALRELYVKANDPMWAINPETRQEFKDKLRYASTLAEYITGKVEKIDPGWLRNFYPRRRDYDAFMKKSQTKYYEVKGRRPPK
jgi:hypothetical protein